MKGHTKIELTNVNTGDVTTVEDDNMVTNALKYFLADAGRMGNGPFPYCNGITSNEPYKTLLGGLLLFDSEITEDVENVLVPNDVTMVGNGSYGISNGDSPINMGSFNSTESGLQADGSIRLVYDFTTAQANGTIKCACLTSSAGGRLGCGNSEDARKLVTALGANYGIVESGYSMYDGYFSSVVNIGTSKKESVRYHFFPNLNENTIWAIEMNTLIYNSSYSAQHYSATGSIKLKKFRVCFSAIDVLEAVPNATRVLEEKDITIPTEISSYLNKPNNVSYVRILKNKDNIYLVFMGSQSYVSPGKYAYILKIDSAFNTTSYKFTNNTEVNLYDFLGIDDDETVLYGYCSSKRLFTSNIADSATANEVDLSTMAGYLFPYATTYNLGNLFYSCGGTSSSYYGYIINTKKNKAYAVNSKNDISYNYGCRVKGNPLFNLIASSGDVTSLKLWRNPLYLATINNLPETITKTAAQTMKVTYTLTFDNANA